MKGLFDSLFNKTIEYECKRQLLDTYRKCSAIIQQINDIKADDFSKYPRELRRDLEKERKNFIRKSLKGFTSSRLEEISKLYYEAYSSLESKDSFIKNDDSFILLIDTCNYILANYNDNQSLPFIYDQLVNIVKQSIIKSKKNFASTPLLDCYDTNGNLIESKYSDFRNVINKLMSNKELEKILEGKLCFDTLLWCLDSDGKFATYSEELKQKRDEEAKLKKQQKKEESERKRAKAKEQTALNAIKEQTKVIIIPDEEKNREIYKYITSELVLKKNILELISYDDFKSALERDLKLSKKQIETYLSEYRELHITNKLTFILNSLPEKYKLILERISLCDNEDNTKIYNAVRNAIFDNRNNDKNLLRIIISILDRYANITKSNKSNIIIFPSEEIFNENLNSVMSSINIDSSALKSILHSLKVLETQNMENLKTKEKSFHEIKSNNNTSFIIGPLKGYRYGAKKSKICLFQISVCEENKKVLMELYNIETVPNVLIVFGFGNVVCENEKDFYSRVIDIAESHSEELLRIYDIFSTPFTTETLESAKKIIESSENSMSHVMRIDSK